MGKSEKSRNEEEIERINRVQNDFFGGLIEIFDPPLPEGVPERLEHIAASGRLKKGEVVLDVGSGTGILVPLIQAFKPRKIVACDLSEDMLDHLKDQYPYVTTLKGDIRNIAEPDASFDVVFINACYPNIADKEKSLTNIARMMKTQGRLVISHPMGKSFIEKLRDRSPFPLDDFPSKREAEALLMPRGLNVVAFEDEPEMYLLLAEKTVRGTKR